MKRFLALLFIAMFTTSAWAGPQISNNPLIDKLKEKGILSDDDIKAIGKDQKANVEIGGRLHVQYRSEGKDTAPAATGAHAAQATGFLVKRMTIELKATVSDLGYFQIEPEFAGSTGWNKLNDAFIGLAPISGLNVYVGQKKVPFSWEELTSSKTLSFIDSGYASQIGVGRQMGAEVEYFLGADKLVVVNAGVYNGMVDTGAVGYLQTKKQRLYSNANVSGNDNGGGNMLAARLELHPFGYVKKGYENFDGATALALGVSYYTSDDKTNTAVTSTSTTTYTVSGTTATASTATTKAMWVQGSNAAGFDLNFRTGGLELTAEYAARTLKYAYNATSGSLATATEDNVSQAAYQIGATYLVTDKLAVGARYDSFDYGDDTKMTSGGTVKAKTDTATTLGVSYYFKKHNLKLQANYITKDESYSAATLGTSEKPSNDVMVVQLGYSF